MGKIYFIKEVLRLKILIMLEWFKQRVDFFKMSVYFFTFMLMFFGDREIEMLHTIVLLVLGSVSCILFLFAYFQKYR